MKRNRALSLAARENAGRDVLSRLGLAHAEPDAPTSLHLGTRPVLLPRRGARRLTLVFSGNSRMLTFPSPLQHDKHTHVMLLKDSSRRFGLLGMPGLGEDYQSSVMNLRRISEALGATELYCIGLSAGGSAALKYGCDLGALGILGFSVPTTLNLDDDPGTSLKDHPQLALLYRHNRHLGIDLAAYYAATSPRPRLMLVYSDSHRRDSWLARRMRGMGGVDLYGLAECASHLSYMNAIEGGHLPALVERLFTLRQFSPASGPPPSLPLPAAMPALPELPHEPSLWLTKAVA